MKTPSDLEINMKASASRIVSSVTGSSVIDITQIFMGVMTYKFNVEVKGGKRYVVRFYPESREHIVQFEPDIIRRLMKLGISVPEVVADSRSDPEAELEYMVYKMVSGVTLSERISTLSKAELDILVKQLVDALLVLKSCEVSGFGDLIDANHARCNSWNDFVRDSFKEGINMIKRTGLFEGHVTAALERLYANLEKYSPIDLGGVAWGDISLSNIIVDHNNKLAALIDFEGILAVEPLLNVGYCFAAYSGSAFYDSFLLSWPDARTEKNIRLIEFYAVLRAIRILRYADEDLPCGAPRLPIDKLLPGFITALSNLDDYHRY